MRRERETGCSILDTPTFRLFIAVWHAVAGLTACLKELFIDGIGDLYIFILR